RPYSWSPQLPPPTLVPRFNTPMSKNLFATQDLDSPSLRFVPRLCLTLMKMVVFQELEKDLISMVIAMKMQGSNLISMVITVKMQGSNEQLETDLGLTSPQDPHFLSEKEKSYRSCCTGGKKILPVGAIHMAEVAKVAGEASAKVAENWICSLSNQPIHWEDSAIQDRCKAKSRVNYSEGVYQRFSSEQQASNYATYGPDLAEEGIDMGMLKKQRPWRVGKKSIIRPQNIKEKVVAWLRKLKVLEGCGLEQDTAEHVPKLEWDLDLLFNTLQNPRDSGPDMEDDNSTLSTPKPKLRLFFEGLAHSSSRQRWKHPQDPEPTGKHVGPRASNSPVTVSQTRWPTAPLPQSRLNLDLLHAGEPVIVAQAGKKMIAFSAPPNPSSGHTAKACHISGASPRLSLSSPPPRPRGSIPATMAGQVPDGVAEGTAIEQTDPGSQLQTPRKTTYNQLNHTLISDDQLPENIILVNTSDNTLQGQMLPVLCTCFMADILVAFSSIIWQIQRYCNNNSQPPKPVKILVAG
uniref:Phosphofurin acidic cluster sorting protein 1/2 C-terminal domain-containing protein n=1 Tax=Myotis lucifugus TaxID=59463 RepID=G1PUR4_MYOLU